MKTESLPDRELSQEEMAVLKKLCPFDIGNGQATIWMTYGSYQRLNRKIGSSFANGFLIGCLFSTAVWASLLVWRWLS